MTRTTTTAAALLVAVAIAGGCGRTVPTATRTRSVPQATTHASEQTQSVPVPPSAGTAPTAVTSDATNTDARLADIDNDLASLDADLRSADDGRMTEGDVE